MSTTTLDTRHATHADGTHGFIVGVTNGPRDLLFRLTETQALLDGAEHVRRFWRETSDGWGVR